MSDARILAAYQIFFGSYFVFAIGRFPWMKIDRPSAAIMLVVANLSLAGFFERLAEWIIERLQPHHLLPTVMFTSGLLSAFLLCPLGRG